MELSNRVLYGFAMAAITTFCIWKGGSFFNCLLNLVTALSFAESIQFKNSIIQFTSVILIALFYESVWTLYYSNPLILLKLFCTVWCTDIGAYFIGKFIAGPKIMPQISPNKTIFGCIGGILVGTMCGVILNFYHGLTISCIVIFGDLLESYAKRIEKIKDTNLFGLEIPGHGGILDRIDGMIVATIMYRFFF